MNCFEPNPNTDIPYQNTPYFNGNSLLSSVKLPYQFQGLSGRSLTIRDKDKMFIRVAPVYAAVSAFGIEVQVPNNAYIPHELADLYRVAVSLEEIVASDGGFVFKNALGVLEKQGMAFGDDKWVSLTDANHFLKNITCPEVARMKGRSLTIEDISKRVFRVQAVCLRVYDENIGCNEVSDNSLIPRTKESISETAAIFQGFTELGEIALSYGHLQKTFSASWNDSSWVVVEEKSSLELKVVTGSSSSQGYCAIL